MNQKLSIAKLPFTHVKLEMTTFSVQTNLISELKAGKRSAQEAFYKEYFPCMYPIAFRFSASKEEAHEIINTAFMSVIKSIHNYSDENFKGWVSTIVRRTAIDYYRKYNNDRPQSSALLEYDEITYNDALSSLQMQEILTLVQQLPNATRTVFNLYVFDDMTHEQIAQKLSISKGTSKWHVSNGRAIMTKLFNALNQAL